MDVDTTQTNTQFAVGIDLWVYNTGRTSRTENRVIRIRNDPDHRADTKDARGNADLVDSTSAGRSWSRREVSINGIHPSELVIVVGELLPDSIRSADNMKQSKVAASVSEAIARKRHQRTFNPCPPVVVRKIQDKKTTLYRLVDKQGGLCRIVCLPSKVHHRVAYYTEWTRGEESFSRAGDRKAKWHSSLNEFCSNFGEPKEPSISNVPYPPADTFAVQEVHTRSGSGTIAARDQPTSTRQQFIARISKYIADNLPTCMIADHEAECATGRDSEEYQLLLTWLLDQDSVDEQHVTDAVFVCQRLWWRTEEVFTAPALFHLARSLRLGSLGDRILRRSMLDIFLPYFCDLFQEGDDDDRIAFLVDKAYRMALNATHKHAPASIATEVKPGLKTVGELLRGLVHHQASSITTARNTAAILRDELGSIPLTSYAMGKSIKEVRLELECNAFMSAPDRRCAVRYITHSMYTDFCDRVYAMLETMEHHQCNTIEAENMVQRALQSLEANGDRE